MEVPTCVRWAGHDDALLLKTKFKSVTIEILRFLQGACSNPYWTATRSK
jgi:hypothetical protein